VKQGLEVGLLLWRVQLQMFVNQTIRSGKPHTEYPYGSMTCSC